LSEVVNYLKKLYLQKAYVSPDDIDKGKTGKIYSPVYQDWFECINIDAVNMKKHDEVLVVGYDPSTHKYEIILYLPTQYKPLTYKSPTNKSIATTSTEIVGTNTKREYLCIVNDSDTEIYIAIGASAELNKGIRLNAGGGAFEMCRSLGNLSTQAVNGIHGVAGVTKNVTVLEGE